MRRSTTLALLFLAAGCARANDAPDGSDATSPGEPGQPGPPGPPVVALSAPGFVPPRDLSPAERASLGTRPTFTPGAPFVLVACRKDAFCDDFEEAAPETRWTSITQTAGTVDFVGPSSSLGAKALRASTTGSGAAAHLTLAGPMLGQQWVGSLAFALRVDALPSAAIGGPEIAVADANGQITRIGFSVRPDGIALHQAFESCSGPSCAARSDVVADVLPGEWRRLTVGIETSGNSAPPYGRIEVTVDGGELIVFPLSVTPFDGPSEVHAGITVSDSAPAVVHVDDVVFFTH